MSWRAPPQPPPLRYFRVLWWEDYLNIYTISQSPLHRYCHLVSTLQPANCRYLDTVWTTTWKQYYFVRSGSILLLFVSIRAGWPPQPLSATLDDQLPSMSGAHGLKDFLCSVHLLESFEGRIYSLEHFHKCKFVPKRTQEDEHYRRNPSNHELLTVRGVDRRAFLKMFRAQITVYCIV